MHQIYRGSWATIVALSSVDTNSGLPRAIRALNRQFSQTSCRQGKHQLLTLGRTLQQHCDPSVWSTRVWTLQEATLSPRCIYFMEEHVYIACNANQYCESVDEQRSALHNMRDEKYLSYLRHSDRISIVDVYGTSVYRDPNSLHLTGLAKDDSRLDELAGLYRGFVSEYTSRQLTVNTDSLNAGSAILAALGFKGHKNGIFWGMLVELSPGALLWSHENRRPRRHAFPSWTWAGWQGQLDTPLPDLVREALRVPSVSLLRSGSAIFRC
jgi:hypothetical protein